jgi:hypothetical protein
MSERMFRNYLIDMDGVLVSGKTLIPGAVEFLDRLHERGIEYLVLTNNSIYTPRDLTHRLRTIGLQVEEGRIFTSAMATARFLESQRPNGKAFVIGESGLTDAIYAVGYVISDLSPDYVVLGETLSYDMVTITKAVQLVADGARFIATNPDPSGPSDRGLVPATGALAALIERATGGVELPRRSFRGDGHDWGPDGYGYHRGCGERSGDNPGADRRHSKRKHRTLSLLSREDRRQPVGDRNLASRGAFRSLYMLPYVVLVAAALYFIVKGTGWLDDLADRRRSSVGSSPWQEIKRPEAVEDQRLEVFRQYLDPDSEEEDER